MQKMIDGVKKLIALEEKLALVASIEGLRGIFSSLNLDDLLPAAAKWCQTQGNTCVFVCVCLCVCTEVIYIYIYI